MAVIPPRMTAKLDKSLAAGEFYEAHQLYRTLFFRYSNQKDFEKAIDLLYDGANKMFDHNQIVAGCDLSEQMMDTVLQADCDVTDCLLDKIQMLFSRMPSANKPQKQTDTPTSTDSTQSVSLPVLGDQPRACADRDKFTGSVLEWAKQKGDSTHGHATVHARLAQVLCDEHNYALARPHFMLSDRPDLFASCLVNEQMSKGLASELELFVAQAVLQLLAADKPINAQKVFTEYTSKHPLIGGSPPYTRPLLNFIWMLLLCVDVKQLTYYTVLVEHYQPSLARDGTYSMYLDKIGQIYFGMPPPNKPKKQAPGGMFANLLQGLMGGDSSDSAQTSSPQPNHDHSQPLLVMAEELD